VTLRAFSNSELRKLPEKDERLRRAMGVDRVPHRAWIGRRLTGLAPEAERQIALLGDQIVEEVQPEAGPPKPKAIDGRMYQAQGPKWRPRDRQKDLVPVGLAQRQRRIEVVQERLSRRGSRRQARLARPRLPTSRPDFRRLAPEPRERSEPCDRGV